jgi:integrase
MPNDLILAPQPPQGEARQRAAFDPDLLRKLVLDAVPSPHTRRSYATALDAFFRFCGGRVPNREMVLEWRAGLETLSPSTINVRLSAVRKMVDEAKRNNMKGSKWAASLTDIPNIRPKGIRSDNSLSLEQAKKLLAVPERSTLKGKRNYVILALLVGCALRRNELAKLDVATIQLREGRWVLADLKGGKDRRIRTVAIPIWVKESIDAWMTAAGIEDGRLLRSISKSGTINSSTLSDWAVSFIVGQSSKQIGIEAFGPDDLRRTCAKLCRKGGGDLEQIKFLLGHSSIQTTERYLGSEQDMKIAVNDYLGL